MERNGSRAGRIAALAVGPEMHTLRVSSLCELAASLRDRGRQAEAAGPFAEAAELQREQLGPDHWLVGVLIIEQGLTWRRRANFTGRSSY